jgi:hypothetical protein
LDGQHWVSSSVFFGSEPCFTFVNCSSVSTKTSTCPRISTLPQMEWSKENRLDLLRSAKSGRVLVRHYAEMHYAEI